MQNETVGQFQSTMETELKSYRDVVASSSTDVPLSARRIVDVVKEAVKTEYRSNIAIMLYCMVLVKMTVLTLRSPCVTFSVALVKNLTSDIVCDWEVRVGLNLGP